MAVTVGRTQSHWHGLSRLRLRIGGSEHPGRVRALGRGLVSEDERMQPLARAARRMTLNGF